MYESPLFLATHEEESGGRSVPTTPLQVAAPGISMGRSCRTADISQMGHLLSVICFYMFLSPVSVFSEAAPSDSTEQASQSVPMVSTSTPGLPVPGAATTGEERDDGLLEPDPDRLESLLRGYLVLVFVFFGFDSCF